MTTAPVGVEDARKREILQATWRLIAERGYHEVRVADIAKAVGTSTGTVHYHFPGKQDVLVEALRYCVQQAFARQSEELRKLTDARERLLRLIDMQLPKAGQVRDEWSVWAQFWAEAALRPELRPTHNDFYDRWRTARVGPRADRDDVIVEGPDAASEGPSGSDTIDDAASAEANAA